MDYNCIVLVICFKKIDLLSVNKCLIYFLCMWKIPGFLAVRKLSLKFASKSDKVRKFIKKMEKYLKCIKCLGTFIENPFGPIHLFDGLIYCKVNGEERSL